MTLQEFADFNGSFVKRTLEDMLHRSKTRDKIADPGLRENNSMVLYNDYYQISGFIEAAYHYGRISFDDQKSFYDELDAIFSLK